MYARCQAGCCLQLSCHTSSRCSSPSGRHWRLKLAASPRPKPSLQLSPELCFSSCCGPLLWPVAPNSSSDTRADVAAPSRSEVCVVTWWPRQEGG
jgi:hypothetical protein